MHRVKKKKNISQVNMQVSGENTGEETAAAVPGPAARVAQFQLNSAGGPLDEEFLEKSVPED
ncbi:hypothetical protein [Desulfotomaculum copahuensis]|uniref:Uncharacterized protein n=1 Tax=Desulfotomaculum copahuensis TaxID=1838280 RepID=A0A1B7LH16_9FIRM|nr:hypothetical protein [Desulfotomaculum copahuensis]OAT85501.1 hypothetical protein A6M21_06195 [Desulfotomaculum copahuensis]